MSRSWSVRSVVRFQKIVSLFPLFMSITLTEHLEDLRKSHAAVISEQERRKKVEESEVYLSLKAQMDAMFADIPDTSEEYAMDKEAVLKAMNEMGRTEIEGFHVKTRKKRSVNVREVLEAMQGDIDNLMLVSTVTQKNLEQFAKDNPEYKYDLRKCIKDEGISVVDILPL